MTTAAIYARYSSDLQNPASIEDQVRTCQAFLAARGWTPAGPFTDHGLSGADPRRPGFQQLLRAIEAGEVNVVVAEALDRLSRDQEHVAGLFKKLTFRGVALVTVAEGEINELHVGLKGTMNALFLKDLGQKTRRGLEGRVRAGRSAGGLSFGYEMVRQVNERGEFDPGHRRINEAEAAVVRRIFEMFAGGTGPRTIARILNEDGVPGPRGRPWRDTTIRGHKARGTGILRNQEYIGRLVWNRQRFIKDPATGKRVSRPNPPETWIITEVPELRILDDDLWNHVQRRLDDIRDSEGVRKARETEFWKHRRPETLLSGKVTCAVCGGAMISAGKDYLACGRARAGTACSNRKGLRRGPLEDLILSALKDQLMAPDLVEEFCVTFQEQMEVQRVQAQANHKTVETSLEQVERKITSLIDAIAEGFRSPDLQARLDTLSAQRDELRGKLSAAPPVLPPFNVDLATMYRQQVGRLHTTLQDPKTRQEAVEQLRTLIEEVRLGPPLDGGGREVELIGEIASMIELSLGAGAKKAASGEAALDAELRRSVKVVAGKRFGLYLLSATGLRWPDSLTASPSFSVDALPVATSPAP